MRPASLPPRVLPLLYFATAHLALALACAAVAADPRGVAGFFYHARMLAIVHLVTLGWITSSILGALYLVGPIALRLHLPAKWPDYLAFVCVATGIVGMVGHFWIEEYGGMAWSGATVGSGILIVGGRVLVALRRARVPAPIAAHIVCAFLNIAGAATLGVLIGIDKVHPILPGYALARVFAHAHLAAIGWASMMVVGIAYRLLPMVLPAQMPAGRRLWISVGLMEAGTIALFTTLLVQSRWIWMPAVLVVGGLGAFLSQVAWMVRRRRPRAPGIPTPDVAVLHAGASFTCMAIAAAIGLWLAIAETTDATLRIAMAYGVFGLLGFLGQLVVGMEGRLLPLFASYWAYTKTGHKGPVPSPHQMASRNGQELVWVLWLFAVPALAIGLTFDMIPFVRAAAWALLAATILNSVIAARIVRHAWPVRAKR